MKKHAISPQNPITIREVKTRADKRRFIHYPYHHYRHNPHWVPPLRLSEWQRFSPKAPFFEHGRMTLFLAERAGEVVGRIAGIDDDGHNQIHKDNLAFFGFFEATDAEVAQTLFAHVEQWAKALGRSALRGPTYPTMNDGAGFQINAFDTSPYVMMPYNPASYPDYVEAAGFSKIKDLYAWMFDRNTAGYARMLQLAARVEKRQKFSLRQVNMKDYANELTRVKHFYAQQWEDNWAHIPYTEREFDAMAQELKLLLEPCMVHFLEIDNALVGLVLGVPDANQLFKKMNGRIFPGIVHFFRRRQIIKQGRLIILGVAKEYRNRGLELVLIREVAEQSYQQLGYTGGECSWVLENNDAMNKGMKMAGADLYKTYRLYQKAL